MNISDFGKVQPNLGGSELPDANDRKTTMKAFCASKYGNLGGPSQERLLVVISRLASSTAVAAGRWRFNSQGRLTLRHPRSTVL
jgi:hypothetical protein